MSTEGKHVLAEGTPLGKYRIVRLLGTGGMADVYEAEDSMLGRRVALKVLPPEFGRDATAVARFEKEVRAAASLNHANIVTIFEVDRADDIHFCAMRLLRGGDLRTRIDKGLSEAEALAIAREITQAFVHAHAAGFVHRDVKPENILFDDQGRAILTDFGIAKAIHSQSKMTATGVSIGTPRYISPEQARGQPVDGRADLYSLGAILYEMLTGKPPFEAEDSLAMIFKHVTEPVPRLPEALARYQPLIDSLMAKEPERRPESASALLAMLNALPQPRPAASRPAPPRTAEPPQAAKPAPTPAPAPAPASTATAVGTGERAYAERLVQEEQRQREAEARRRADAGNAQPAAPVPPAITEPVPQSPTVRARRSVLASAADAPVRTDGGARRVPLFVGLGAVLLGGGLIAWWLATPSGSASRESSVSTVAAASTRDEALPPPPVALASPAPAAVAMTPMPTTSTPEPAPAIAQTAATTSPDEAARRKAEAAEKRRKQQQEAERKRREALAAAATPTPPPSKAERLARERQLCKRHVSELFPGWEFTYADMAEYPGVKPLGDGRLATPPLATDYGGMKRYEIDRNGCIVSTLP
ncbi:protein kinase [Fontimonas sp. SYSU GA230001]|uniref:serine/threonine-protein kinase n=1 Tax=Fontimonas sp. SYSU GA230001 TaxID=3142450 RepID=UPI0032B429B3